jgi:hypothetical protein
LQVAFPDLALLLVLSSAHPKCPPLILAEEGGLLLYLYPENFNQEKIKSEHENQYRLVLLSSLLPTDRAFLIIL